VIWQISVAAPQSTIKDASANGREEALNAELASLLSLHGGHETSIMHGFLSPCNPHFKNSDLKA